MVPEKPFLDRSTKTIARLMENRCRRIWYSVPEPQERIPGAAHELKYTLMRRAKTEYVCMLNYRPSGWVRFFTKSVQY